MYLQNQHLSFYRSFKIISFVLMIIGFISPVIILLLFSDIFSQEFMGYLLVLNSIFTMFIFPGFLMGFREVINLEQSHHLRIHDIINAMFPMLFFSIGFYLLSLLIEYGLGFLIRLVNPGGYSYGSLGIIYYLSVVLIVLISYIKKS